MVRARGTGSWHRSLKKHYTFFFFLLKFVDCGIVGKVAACNAGIPHGASSSAGCSITNPAP